MGSSRASTKDGAADHDRLQQRWCAECAAETLFELPPCQDGHGDECLDLACVECGAALVLGVLLAAGELTRRTRAA